MRIKAAGKTQWGPTFTDKVPEILSRAYGPIVYAQIMRTPWKGGYFKDERSLGGRGGLAKCGQY